MILARVTALRASSVNALARSARTAPSRTSQQCFRWSQQMGRRQYSSAKDDIVQKASSDIPWLISGIAITIGGTYVALQPRDPVHHDEHGEGHSEEHEEEEEESSEEESKDEDKSNDGGEKGKDSAEDANKEDAPKDDVSKDDVSKDDVSKDDVSKDDVSKDDASKEEDAETKEDGEEKDSQGSEDKPEKSASPEVSNKGKTKSASNSVTHEETGTGKKLRLDSSAGKTIGEGSSSGDEDEMSHKQRGMSNTDTKHSTDPSKDPEMSKKGEGTAETAKIKGTVDPSRPQV
ncbi:cylicin I [Venturia nashicola]|nr:cylicin I [Venturia nashicola]